jgi:hypothetical protein
VVGALLAAALIVRAGVVGLQPSAASVMPPADNTALLRRALGGLADPRTRIPAQLEQLAAGVARTSPLTFEPFFVEARVAAQEGRGDDAIRLMEEAVRRRPNHILTRLHMAAYYGQANESEKAIGHLNWVLRYAPEAHQFVFPELTRSLSSPRNRELVAQLLAADPSWRSDFLRTAQNSAPRPEDARALLQTVSRLKGPRGDVRLERDLYVRSLMSAGRYSEARAEWLRSQPGASGANAYLTDGQFRRPLATGPFSWALFDESAGRAEIAGSGDNSELSVQYFGGTEVKLAEQVLALRPGRYRLTYMARSNGGTPRGQLFWSFNCLPDQRFLTRIPVTRLGSAFAPNVAEITIPTACNGQTFQLVAETGDTAGTLEASFRNVGLAPL